MEPETPNYSSGIGSVPGGRGSKKLLVGVLVVVAVVLLIVFALMKPAAQPNAKTGGNTGTMDLIVNNLADTNSLSLELNQKPLAISDSLANTGSTNIQLPSGAYTLQISKLGYQPFSTHFSITSSRTTIINADLQPLPVTPITSWQQVRDSYGHPANDPATFDAAPGGLTPGAINIILVKYFYNQTWAFIVVNDGYINSFAVAQYDFVNNRWVVISGSDNYFSAPDVKVMPLQVQAYLTENNYTYPGS